MGIDPVSLAITVALNAASMALTASQHYEGPRVTDLNVTVADYGTPLNNFLGRNRVEPSVFYAEPINETRIQRKTKGGKYAEYEYDGTFACVVADHQVQSFDAMWLDRRLVFDSSGAIVQGEGDEALNVLDYTSFYYGTSDQDPNERMQASIEAEEGPGTCPAFLDVSYVMFEGLPLYYFSNRFPQVSMLATRGGSTPISAQTLSMDNPFDGATWASGDPSVSPSGSYVFNAFGLQGLGLDPLNYILTDNDVLPYLSNAGIDDDGNLYGNDRDSYASDTLVKVEEFGAGAVTVISTIGSNGVLAQTKTRPFKLPDGTVVVAWLDYNSGLAAYELKVWDSSDMSITVTNMSPPYNNIADGALVAGNFAMDSYGDIWFFGSKVSVTSMIAVRVFNYGSGSAAPDETIIPDVTTTTNPTGAFVDACHTPSGWLVTVDKGDAIALFAEDDFTEIARIANTEWQGVGGAQNPYLGFLPAGLTSVWIPNGSTEVRQINASDLSVLNTHQWTDWAVGDTPSLGTLVYVAQQSAFVSGQVGVYPVTIRYLAIDGEITLGSVMNELAANAGMTSGDYDFSDLTQTIPGIKWTQASGYDIASPLLELYDSDVRQNGFVLEGVRRGGVVTGDAINYEWFVPRDTSDDSGDSGRAFEVRLSSESDLPRRIVVNFSDYDAEHQANSAAAQRYATSVETKREMTIDMLPLSITTDAMQPLVERALRRRWLDDMTVMHSLPPNYLELVPGTVRDIQIDDTTYLRSRLKRSVIRPSREIELVWARDRESVDDPSLYRGEFDLLRTSPGAIPFGRPLPTLISPVGTELFVMDVPLLTDADERTTPFIVVGAAPAIDGAWPGTSVESSDSGADDSYSRGFAAFSANGGSTWGTTINALSDALSTVIDEGSELYVQLGYGTLGSVAEDALLSDQTLNMALIGANGRWEVIQFRDAILQSEGEWLLTGLLRGQRGTEWATGLHQAGDTFVLVSGLLARRDLGASEIGDTDFYRATTLGVNDTYAEPHAVEFRAVAHKPLSVAHLEAIENGSDLDVSWIRRSRVGGSALNGQDVPLGETSEAYRLRIYDQDGATVRTEELTSPAFTYTAAQRTTDLGAGDASGTIGVVQLSPSLGIEGTESTIAF